MEEEAGGGGGAERNMFQWFVMAAYFFVLIPPRLLTSKAPALWRSRTECDWEIWRSIFSQSTHSPRGDGIWFFPLPLFPASSFVVSQWTSGLVPRRKSWDLNWISSPASSQELPPDWSSQACSTNPLFFPLYCRADDVVEHATALCRTAGTRWLDNVTLMSCSWISLPEEVEV